VNPNSPELPEATIRRRGGGGWVWAVPILALALAAGLVYRAIDMRGHVVTVQLSDGHGLASGTTVRYRGIAVGKVLGIELRDSLESVVIRVSLTQQGDRIARRGARFWVVRPEIGFEGIAGLDTVMGPNYLTVLPGDGPPQRHFLGLERAPVVESPDPDDLEVLVRAQRQGSLLPTAPVTYRGIRIGIVTSVGLTSDGGAVEGRLHVEKAYAPLVREGSRFWRIGGITADVGISGISVDIDSLPTLLKGGVAMATPPGDEAGEPVRTGHRFELASFPEPEWLRWQPLVAVGNAMLPVGATTPTLLRARLAWRQGRLLVFRSTEARVGWVLPTTVGLLAPLDLLEPGDRAKEGTVELEIAGRGFPLPEPEAIAWRRGGIALARVDLPEDARPWPPYRARRPEAPEDAVLVFDPTADPVPIASDRLLEAPQGDAWLVDRAVPIDREWHGASVVSRRDGRIVGMLLARSGDPRIALDPDALARARSRRARSRRARRPRRRCLRHERRPRRRSGFERGFERRLGRDVERRRPRLIRAILPRADGGNRRRPAATDGDPRRLAAAPARKACCPPRCPS